jgi:hypothetical protein
MEKTAGDSSSDIENGLLYDLRQYYARIVGETLVEIAIARKAKNFSEWLELLECLHTEVNQKFDDTEKKDYAAEKEKCFKVINKYPMEFQLKSSNVSKRAEIFNAINALDMWLRDAMEHNAMFGRKWDDDGL